MEISCPCCHELLEVWEDEKGIHVKPYGKARILSQINEAKGETARIER